jgi:hypothetical protein
VNVEEDVFARALEEDAKAEFEEAIVERLETVPALCILPRVGLAGSGTISSTCIEKDSFRVSVVLKPPRELVEVLHSRSVSRSESIIISTSVSAPLSLDSLIVGLIAVEREGAEVEVVDVLAVFIGGLAVEAVDLSLDPDEEAETVFIRRELSLSLDVLLAAFFSSFAFTTCFSNAYSSIFAVVSRMLTNSSATISGSRGMSSCERDVVE